MSQLSQALWRCSMMHLLQSSNRVALSFCNRHNIKLLSQALRREVKYECNY
ncbi:MAG: hypothetical protein RIR09_824 [Pseudomonadota bacterium]